MAYPHNAPSNAPPSHLPPSQPPTNPPPSMIASIPANPPAPQAHHPIHHHPPSLPPHPSPHAYPNYPPMPHNYPPSGPPPGYLMLPIPFPVKPLFNNILNAPDNIGEMRRRFFLLETPIIQSHYEHEIYWPFMDNFWVRNKVKDSADCRTEYYWCRLFRKQDQRSAIPPELRKRKCNVRSAVGCEMKLRKRFWKDGTVEISNHGTCVHHCHSMDEMDQIKRNSAVRLAIGNEIGKGYKPTEVKRVLLNNPEILGAAGGQSITIKDCHNAALVFNKENKEQATGKGDDEIEPQEETRDEDGPVLDAPRQTDNQAPAERPRTGEDPISPQTPSQKEGQNHQRSNQHTSTEQTRNVSNEREAGSKKPKAEK